jgi:hypothetical protein
MNKNDLTFEQKLKSKIERKTIEHNKALAYFENASFDAVYKNGANLLAPLLVEVYNSLECNMTFHRLGGLDDCEPCKLKLKLEQFTEE